MHPITTLAAGLLALALASDALAGESALVGKLNQDGTIQLYKNRFLPKFEDGTLVATIEATPAPGGPRLTRASADGCVSETTVLRIAENGGLWAFDQSPVAIRRCNDNGCQAEFDELPWSAGCVEEASLGCVCKRTNTDQVIFETAGYCTRFQRLVHVWDLDDWFHPQFVQ